jgi:anaerobic selenocysteine-containing dehydrogenase
MQEALDSPSPFVAGIDFKKLKTGATLRLNVPEDGIGSNAQFATPSGKIEFYSQAMAELGFDPLPRHSACTESPENHALHGRFPLQLVAPPSVHFLNSTFGAVAEQRERMGRPTVKIHPDDARARGIAGGDAVRVFNERGKCQLWAEVTEDVRPGVVAADSIWWPKHSPGGRGINTLVSNRLTDLGGGSTFHCNLVDVEKQ